MKQRSTWLIKAGIFGIINLIFISILVYFWVLFFNSYSDYFQINAQYFPFFVAHATVVWVFLNTAWLTSWSFHYLRKSLAGWLFWGIILYALFISTWSAVGLYRYYYQMGQQTSWLRLFNINEQITSVSIWLSSYLLPSLLLLVLLMYLGIKQFAKKQSPAPSAKIWVSGLIASLLLLLVWGMVLSYRNAYLLSQSQLMSGSKHKYSLIAIYNPISAIVALIKDLFLSPSNTAKIISHQHVYFVRPSFSAGTWPGFFAGFFYTKIILMALFSALSIVFSYLLAFPKREK